MKPIYAHLGGALALSLAIAACVPQPRATPPAQTPPPVMTPSPTPPPAPVVTNWMDAAQTPGDWRYTDGTASFSAGGGRPLFAMRCDAASRSVILSRAGPASAAPRLTIRTESQTRTLTATAATVGVESRLAASDRLLDAMALSKGRFAVELAGAPTLYLPSWAEVTRVIEDCR